MKFNRKANRKERKTMKNKTFVRNLVIISLLCVMMIASLISVTLSWFKNSIDTAGPSITSGRIDVSLTEYHFSDGQWSSIEKYTSPADNAEAYTKISDIESFKMNLSGTPSRDDVFYVIRKNEGSMPVDVSLGFVIDGYDESASVSYPGSDVIGGFWYKLDDVTEEYRESASYFTTGDNNPINTENQDLYKQLYLINFDTRVTRLDTDDIVVYRLTCGYANDSREVANKYNKSYNINLKFCVSQLGGLDGSAGGNVYSVSTEEELRSKLNDYKPGDGIFVESDITFYGDLVIDRPLKLYVQGHTLDIEGNLTVTYPDRGRFLINTQRGGRINVNAVGNSGSLIVDIPNARLELVGSGNSDRSKGDIYIENDYYVYASYSEGIIISSSYIRDLSDMDAGFKNMKIADATRVTVSANTQVGKLIVESNSTVASIYNYGYIRTIDFRQMKYEELTAHIITDQNVDNVSVQCRLENAGIVDKVYLNEEMLPGMTMHGLLIKYNENRFIDEENGKFHGNTRLINRLGGQMTVESEAVINYADNTKDPIQYVIEEDTNITYVEKVLTDENGEALTTNEFIIRYTNVYGDNGVPNYDTTLADVLAWYTGEGLDEAHKFTIICYGGKTFTPEDYATLNEYTSLEKLDLSGVESSNEITPGRAFSSLSSLSYLSLPNDKVLSAYAFEGTALDEVTIQSSYATIEANAFVNAENKILIKYVHLMQSGAKYENLLPAKQYIFVVDSVTLSTLRSQYSSYAHRFFLDAEKYGDYFLRPISDDVCELAVYVGSSFNYVEESKNLIQNTSRYSSFDFNDFSYREDGVIKTFEIRSFDDYAFYGVINKTNNALEIHFKNPNSIGNYAFYKCTGLIGKVTFSGTVNIGSYAFAECTGIERVLGVDAFDSKIGSYAFYNCSSIYEVYAPGFTHVGAYSFKNCKKIYAVRMPQLYSMGKEAFLQSQYLHYLETALIIDGEGWDGIHKSSLMAVYTNICNAYDIRSFVNYVVNVDQLPVGKVIPESLPNVFQYSSDGAFYNWSHFIKVIVPTGYESYVSHLSSLGTYVHTKASVKYNGNAKYLKLIDSSASGKCERWDAPYRFEKLEVDGKLGVQYTPADYLYEEVEDGARIIVCFDDQISGTYYLPDIIRDGDKTVKVTEMDTKVFFTTHLGIYEGATCSLYFGKNIRRIENDVFKYEPNKSNGHDNYHITRKMALVNFGGLEELTPCIVNNKTAYNRGPQIEEVFAPNVRVIKEGALKSINGGIYLDEKHFPNLEVIEKNAFNGNKNISGSIELPALIEIGETAFNGCSAITSFTAPLAQTIGASAFASCSKLTAVYFDSVKTVGDSAFSSCSSLNEAYMPNVETIGKACFRSCASLKAFSSEKLTTMGEDCFYAASALSTVYVPNLTEVPKNAFKACSIVNISLLEATSIGESAFEGNRSLRTLNAPKVTYIGKNALYECPFWWINLPSFVSATSNSSWTVGFKGAVYGDLGDVALTSYVSHFRVSNDKISNDKIYVVTNTNVKSISAAYDPSNVIILRSDGTRITYDNIWREWTAEEEEIPFRIYVKDDETKTATLVFLNGFYAEETEDGKYTLQESITVDGQTYTVTNLLQGVASKFNFEGNSLVLPDEVKDIPQYFAYQNTTLSGISSIGVNNDIGQHAFYGCTALTSAEFPNAISLQQHAFDGCSLLSSVNLNALQRIEGGGGTGSGVGGHFRNCTSLVSLSFPRLTYIADYTNATYTNHGIFEGCTKLASVSFGSEFNQVLIARNMFKNTPSLTMITFDGCPTIRTDHDCKIPAGASIFVSLANFDAFTSKNPTYAAITHYYEILYNEAETGITYYLKSLPTGEYEIALIDIPNNFNTEQIVLPSVYEGKNIISMYNSAWKNIENQGIRNVVLPDNFKFFNHKDFVANSIESFTITDSNTVFATIGGVLYSKDGSVLIAYPKNKSDESFTLPSGVTTISSKAFAGAINLITLNITQNVTVCDEAFYKCARLQNVVFTDTQASSFIGEETFVDCDFENSITVWVPVGTVDSYRSAVVEDVELYSKFQEGTP